MSTVECIERVQMKLSKPETYLFNSLREELVVT